MSRQDTMGHTSSIMVRANADIAGCTKRQGLFLTMFPRGSQGKMSVSKPNDFLFGNWHCTLPPPLQSPEEGVCREGGGRIERWRWNKHGFGARRGKLQFATVAPAGD